MYMYAMPFKWQLSHSRHGYRVPRVLNSVFDSTNSITSCSTKSGQKAGYVNETKARSSTLDAISDAQLHVGICSNVHTITYMKIAMSKNNTGV